MYGTLFIIFVALVIGELVCGALVKAIKGGDPFYGHIGRATFNLLSGAVMYEIARINMVVIDDFDWEEPFSETEIFMYVLDYAGMFLFLVGLLSLFAGVYEIVKAKNSSPQSSPAKIPVVKNGYVTDNDSSVPENSTDDTEHFAVNTQNSYVCSECLETVSTIPCSKCGHIPYPMKPIYIDDYIISCPVCERRQHKSRVSCLACNQLFINGQKDIPYWCYDCGMPGPFTGNECSNCGSTAKIFNE